ncbi:hypothetical protein ACQP2Y_45825 [Actinoplanes sp. CA-051413]|uniref:hypothetical protein n=1 Tax=Actinoplanes sp. CA-051413 TaxID=3239899 RepID=UPI003D961FC9
MMRYWTRLARPGWVAGASGTAVGLAVASAAVGWADNVPGTVHSARPVMLVLAVALAAPLRDLAAAVLDSTQFSRPGRRLAPPAVAATELLVVALALAVLQATRVRGAPWAGLAVEAVGMAAVAVAAGTWCPARVDPVFAAITAVGLLVLLDQASPFGPWLTAGPGHRWEAGRWAWLAVTALGLVAIAGGLRDPGGGGLRRRLRMFPYRVRRSS